MHFQHQGYVLSDQWKDYELLSTGDGMKEERWGDYILVRPDPQILWSFEDKSLWQNADAYYHRNSKGGGTWEYKKNLPESWTIHYKKLRFKIRPTNFKHTGLFPEQAANWDWMTQRILGAKRSVRVLNLFGYTGAATVACAAAGAQVCHVDAIKGMVEWCRENAKLSGLENAPIRYIVDDCVKFVRRELKRGQHYDAILMDPPVFGRGSNGEMWKIEEHLTPLLRDCRKLLSENPVFFLINAYTAGISPIVAGNLLSDTMQGFKGDIKVGEIGLPAKRQKSMMLPCGVFARWQPTTA